MFGIVTAIDAEKNAITKSLTDNKTVNYANIDFVLGKLGDNDVCICASDTGKVNASIAACIMVEKFKCNILMKTGIAGGLKEFENPLDVIICSKITYHDFDVEEVDHYKRGYNTNPRLVFNTDEEMNNKLSSLLDKENITHYIGPTLSGDLFVSKDEDVKEIIEYFPESYAADMEACAIAHVAHQYNIKCCIIQTLSDIAVKANNHVDYWNLKNRSCQVMGDVVVKFIKEYKDE